jgi:hypothetical protein
MNEFLLQLHTLPFIEDYNPNVKLSFKIKNPIYLFVGSHLYFF